MFMRPSSLCLSLIAVSFPVWAQRAPRGPLGEIYPYRPMPAEEISSRLQRLTEDPGALRNLFEIDRRGLSSADASTRPWAGSFWPLIQGQIANTWQSKTYFDPFDFFSWKRNLKDFHKRSGDKLARVMELEEKELNKLAPSEKYDLLLGDKSFDLTNRIWNFISIWGEQKTNGFISSIDIPSGYRLPKMSDRIAMWEGICHGWASAAGSYPAPPAQRHSPAAERPQPDLLPGRSEGPRLPRFRQLRGARGNPDGRLPLQQPAPRAG